MIVGRDLEHAMAMALVDAAIACLGQTPAISAFLQSQVAAQAAADTARLQAIEATRVDMETF